MRKLLLVGLLLVAGCSDATNSITQQKKVDCNVVINGSSWLHVNLQGTANGRTVYHINSKQYPGWVAKSVIDKGFNTCE